MTDLYKTTGLGSGTFLASGRSVDGGGAGWPTDKYGNQLTNEQIEQRKALAPPNKKETSMTDQERKVMEMALEALQVMKAGQHAEEKAYMDKVIEALRQALAQPEQEPVHFLANGVRYKVTHQRYYGCSIVGLPENLNGQWVALVDATDDKHLQHTAPPSKPWVSLTEDEIKEGAKYSWVDYQAFQSVAWWADDKLKEKNNG